jgi:putative MATE family efflux protein
MPDRDRFDEPVTSRVPSTEPAAGHSPDSTAEILRLAWPVMAGQVLLSLTGVVDRMMIGRLAEGGTAAVPLAAVGYASQLFHLIHSTLFAVGLACVALMARAIVARDPDRARHAFAGSAQVSLAVTGLYALLLFFGSERVIGLLGAEPAVVDQAAPYLELMVVASLMLSFTMICDSAFRANRDTRTPMWIAMAVAAAKLGLNGILIFGLGGFPRLELMGAGIATAASQALGLALYVAVLLRTPHTSPTALLAGDLVRKNPITREIVRIALPGIGERIVLNLGLLSYFWVLSRGYGTITVAAYTVGVSILSFSWIPGSGYAQACSTIVGQALGARSSEGALRGAQRALRLAVATAFPLGLFCAWQRIALAELFTSDAEVIAALSPFMLCLGIAQPFLQAHFTLGGAHRGAGDTMTPLIAAAVGNWCVRVPIAVLLGVVFQVDVVWLWAVLILDHVARLIWLGTSYARGRWRRLPPEKIVQADDSPATPRGS